jgi:hypothetical protein
MSFLCRLNLADEVGLIVSLYLARVDTKNVSEAGDVGIVATLLFIYVCIFQNAGNRMRHE